MKANLIHGDFTGLAKSYSKFRPGYSSTVADLILSLVKKELDEIVFADVGAGTGIWTRIIDAKGTGTSIAIEPNDDMFLEGMVDSKGTKIIWSKGTGEATGLADDSIDLLTMASSFHWVNFNKGVEEFSRVLRKGGVFAAIWNPRIIDSSPLLLEIENKIRDINPSVNRISSGNSNFVENLSIKLLTNPYFEDLTYIEGRHLQKFTPDQYIGVWESVNDVRFQLGESGWNEFIGFVKNKIKNLEVIEQTYLTRAWTVKRKL